MRWARLIWMRAQVFVPNHFIYSYTWNYYCDVKILSMEIHFASLMMWFHLVFFKKNKIKKKQQSLHIQLGTNTYCRHRSFIFNWMCNRLSAINSRQTAINYNNNNLWTCSQCIICSNVHLIKSKWFNLIRSVFVIILINQPKSNQMFPLFQIVRFLNIDWDFHFSIHENWYGILRHILFKATWVYSH